MRNRLILSNHRQRQVEGCFWLGCFTPLSFIVIAGLILAKSLTDWLRPQA